MFRYHLVLPMAGAGSRFSKLGYDTPKPLLPIMDKPAFSWATRSLTDHLKPLSITAVVLEKHIKEWELDKALKAFEPNIKIIVLSEVTKGATITCLKAAPKVASDAPIAFLDCDLVFSCASLYNINKNENLIQKFNTSDGVLMSFNSQNPSYSYLRDTQSGRVVETYEKKVISSHAIAGCYWFKNSDYFIEQANKYLNNCKYNEYFMSGVYEQMINDGAIVTHINVDFHLSFGTPDEYMTVQNRPEWSYFKND